MSLDPCFVLVGQRRQVRRNVARPSSRVRQLRRGRLRQQVLVWAQGRRHARVRRRGTRRTAGAGQLGRLRPTVSGPRLAGLVKLICIACRWKNRLS